MRISKILWLLIFGVFWAMPVLADTQLNEVDVIGQLDKARNSIVPSLGATQYNIGQGQISDASQGEDASFNQVILRAPGTAQDSYGQLHIRGEHANLQYRINDVLLPEGITGFGQELDTRFVDNVSLITGSLPAQYGFHTAGIVDIHTKTGAFNNGGTVSMYGGSNATVEPSFAYGGSDTKKDINYFVTGSYHEDDLGIENTTNDRNAIHDNTKQQKAFAYVSKIIDDTSRINFMLSASHADFQIPDNPGQTTYFDAHGMANPGIAMVDSDALNERQSEENYYAIAAYQKALDQLNLQVSAFTRYSWVMFKPDDTGDLDYNGVATQVENSLFTNGLELDASYQLNDKHTLRTGSMVTISQAVNDNDSLLFPLGGSGEPTLPVGSIIDDHNTQGEVYGLYLQDEWKATDKLTINYGGRFDQSYQYINEYQFSPRVNAVYDWSKKTTLHAGYARYFTPAPVELEQNSDPGIYNNTSNALEVTQNDPVKAERAHYFDAGITHHFTPAFTMGLDSYYKLARNQLDEGQFGTAPIFTSFNYKYGRIYGTEVTANYQKGGFEAYANLAWSRALGKGISSAEFNFSQDDLNYINDHWVPMDHDQSLTVSSGVSYAFRNSKAYADVLFGSGLRQDGDTPNGKRVGSYNPVNLGLEHTFKMSGHCDLKLRFDVVNVFDEVYELRSGSGIGVFAPQYGPRRGFYGGMTLDF